MNSLENNINKNDKNGNIPPTSGFSNEPLQSDNIQDKKPLSIQGTDTIPLNQNDANMNDNMQLTQIKKPLGSINYIRMVQNRRHRTIEVKLRIELQLKLQNKFQKELQIILLIKVNLDVKINFQIDLTIINKIDLRINFRINV